MAAHNVATVSFPSAMDMNQNKPTDASKQALVSTMSTNDSKVQPSNKNVTNAVIKNFTTNNMKKSPTVQVTHGFVVPIPTHKSIPIDKSTSTISPSTTTSLSLNDKRHKISPSSIFDPALKRKANHPRDALDALVTLAHISQNRLATISDDSETMPPPPNRRVRRMRSASNPEGMEKWDAYSYNDCNINRMHFVLPSSILEEELAHATDACEAHEKLKMVVHNQQRPIRRTLMTDFSIHSQPNVNEEGLLGTSPTTITSPVVMEDLKGKINNKSKGTGKKNTTRKKSQKKSQKGAKSNSDSASGDSKQAKYIEFDPESTENEFEEEDIDESELEPEELLKRARNRLFEDLSAENGLEKGGMAMPHSIDKYKEIYNKNGRIGIYTPAERAAIISKFNSKRTRRTWKKKIRYNCRKSLADRRMRVKGRFVKRAVEQNKKVEVMPQVPKASPMKSSDENPALESEISSSDSSRTSSPIPIAPPSGPLAPVQENMDVHEDDNEDADMPDVEDLDAGFKPTSSQPFRRTRRHTIT